MNYLEPFSTPHNLDDGYIDENRPEAHPLLLATNMGPRLFHWSQVARKWYSASLFLPSPTLPQPIGMWSARMLLESAPPRIESINLSGEAYPSSARNSVFATIGRLTALPNPERLLDYYSYQNQHAFVHFPIQMDPTLSMTSESDTIWGTRLYIVFPVCRAIYYSSSTRIMTRTEESRSDGGILSRLDMSFMAEARGHWIPYAILEFKRPGAIKPQEWEPAILNQGHVDQGFVGPGAENICRQLHKYAHSCRTPFVGVCDGITALMLRLDGNRDSRMKPQGAIANSASFRWVVREKMKRDLYI